MSAITVSEAAALLGSAGVSKALFTPAALSLGAAPTTPPHRHAKVCAVAPKVLGPPPALRRPGPAAAAC